jgi:uncharacterized protein (DUF2141 family)
MLKNNLRYITLLLIVLIVSCAKRGTITGGLKDTLAPVLKTSFPKNYSINFKDDEIKLVFNENVKLKNLNKQLVISPPMKYEPIISPTSATKTLSIKIKDTLKSNTTYSLNFGQSIADNNEGNPFNQFKYVFSTGNYIDSLALGGRIKDAYNLEVEPFVSIMLYEVNDTFTDSVVYNKSPRYITNTLDSLKTFRLENLKAGKYLLVALKDQNNNNKFDPKTEKIGFIKHFITIPTDTVYELELFKETVPFKAFKPVQTSGNRLLMGYEGNMKSIGSRPKLILKNNENIVPTITTQFPKKDSLQIWYKPIKVDSLALTITNENFKKDYTIKIKDQKKDSLNSSAVQNGILHLRDRFIVESTTPLIRIDDSKMKIIDQDSVAIAFTSEYDDFNQQLYFNFKKEPSQKYTFTILPAALTDFFETSNDTLSFKLNTKSTSDYGNLRIQLQNVKYFPVIVELTNNKGDIIASEYTEDKTTVDFNLLEPKLFTLRIIYDENKNKAYDTGNYLEKRYAEEVIYFSKEIDVRANWDVEQVFDVSLPYTPEPKNKLAKKKG